MCAYAISRVARHFIVNNSGISWDMNDIDRHGRMVGLDVHTSVSYGHHLPIITFSMLSERIVVTAFLMLEIFYHCVVVCPLIYCHVL